MITSYYYHLVHINFSFSQNHIFFSLLSPLSPLLLWYRTSLAFTLLSMPAFSASFSTPKNLQLCLTWEERHKVSKVLTYIKPPIKIKFLWPEPSKLAVGTLRLVEQRLPFPNWCTSSIAFKEKNVALSKAESTKSHTLMQHACTINTFHDVWYYRLRNILSMH